MEKITCKKCKKGIDADSKHCSFCGAKIKGKDRPGFIADLLKNKSALFIISIIILVIALFILLNYGKPKIVDIDMRFSIYPDQYKRAVILALYFDEPLENASFLSYLSEAGSDLDAPVTAFLTAQKGKEYEDFITGYPSLAYNISSLEGIDIEAAGYINQPYTEIPYKYQERLIRQSKLSFKDNDIYVEGFFPPLLQANYDTILAAENNNIEFIILNVGNATEPFHPDSMVGGKMNIMIYPLYQEKKIKDKGTFIFLLNKEAIKEKANFRSFVAGIPRDDTWFTTASELNDYIRKTEKMSAELTTDYKAMESYINYYDLMNSTKIDFSTSLVPLRITEKKNNRTIEPVMHDEGFYIMLDEDDSYIEIEWRHRDD